MKNKKIKIFLGGYVNSINAQNLNCRSLALHLNKERFKVGVMTYPGGKLPMGKEFDGVKIFRLLAPLYRPLYFLRNLNYLRGIIWCDVAYLPKGEIYKFCKFILKVLKKKAFITVEGVIQGTNLEKMLTFCKTEDNIRDYYNYTTKTFAITKYMANVNKESLNIKSDGVLYLGIDLNQFQPKRIEKPEFKNIVFIGNNMRYKGIEDIYSLAELFSDLTFHIVGGGIGYDASAEIRKRNLDNVIYHGLMSHGQLSEFLQEMDIHVFPSRSEGFPKVTLETAAAGVPSIVYSDYGASEWITTGKDGFVVDTFEEIVSILKDLQSNPSKIKELSRNAMEMAKRFDWNNIIEDWETVITDLAHR